MFTLTSDFDTVPHKILMNKLVKYRVNQWAVRWIEKRLNCKAQRVVMSRIKSSWRPVISGVCQGSTPGPILFSCNMSADVTKLGAVADTPYGCAAIQEDCNRLKKWVNRNSTQGNEKFCTWGGKNPRHWEQVWSKAAWQGKM